MNHYLPLETGSTLGILKDPFRRGSQDDLSKSASRLLATSGPVS
jgi:hypothetical protein